MSCCWSNDGDRIFNGEYCQECGAMIDEDGNAIGGCEYSPITCSTCGNAECDGSC